MGKSILLPGAVGCLVFCVASWLRSGEPDTVKPAPAGAKETAALLDKLRSAKNQASPRELQAAWDKLVKRGPQILLPLLEAMDTPDTVAANWLGTAYDRIADSAVKTSPLNADVFLRFARDASRQGRARRLALETAEKIQPGTGDRLIRDSIYDPEFGFDGIELKLAELAKAKDLPADKARAAYRELLAATTDVPQAQLVAGKLKALSTPVSLADVFGFPRDWYVLGPFDGAGKKSFHTAYPPESKVDLKASYAGKDGKTIIWKKVNVPEAVGGTYPVMINLRQLLGAVEDAAGFAYTVLDLPAEREVEIRGGADDNLSVWVNGKHMFAFEEWTNGMRLDRHRFSVRLRAGQNTVLVKVCQGKGGPTDPDGTWEFVLRICDAAGRGVPFKTALPAVN